MSTERIIKKYQNRRLYDTEEKIYITFDEIKELVFKRIHFKIIDAKTKKDLTQNTLLQIIMEEEANNNPLFSTDILQDFIRFYHDKSTSLFADYLEKAMPLFHQQKDFFKNQWQAYQTQTLNMPSLWPTPLSRTATEKKSVKNKKKK